MTDDTARSKERRSQYEPYPAEKARQGEIVLKTKLARIVFFTGLFGGFVLLTILAIYLAFAGVNP